MPKRRLSLLNRLSYHIKGPHPLHPFVWRGRLSPLTFRRFQPSDVSQCLELYKLNEPGRFPEGAIKEYEKTLREQSSYFLVAEREGQVIASGGISYFQKPHLAVFCFGLVGPRDQENGLGTALFLARLALLNGQPFYRILIFAVAKSFGFYERFGFVFLKAWRDVHGEEHPIGSLVISHEEVMKCRKLLKNQGISFPDDKDRVPFRKETEEPPSAVERSWPPLG